MPVEWKMDFVSTTQILLKKRRNKVTLPVSSHFLVAAYIHETSRSVKLLTNPGWTLILQEIPLHRASFVGYLWAVLNFLLKANYLTELR